MKDKAKDIRDDEIRVIGEDDKARFKGWKWLLLLLAGIVAGSIVWALLPQKPAEPPVNPEPRHFRANWRRGRNNHHQAAAGKSR